MGVFRYLAPDAWEDRPFLFILAGTCLSIWLIRTIAYYEDFQNLTGVSQLIFLLDATVSTATVFGMNIWALSSVRKLNYFKHWKKHLLFWLILVPNGILFFLISWLRYFNSDAFIIISIIVLLLYFTAGEKSIYE